MSTLNSRSEQARIKGARSRGPITPEGKARSSRNALKSGRYTERAVLLRNESRMDFELLFQALVQRFRPRDSYELRLIRELATVEWRLARYDSMETRIVDQEYVAQEAALLAAEETATSDITLLAATDSVLENSKVPAFLSTRSGQLVYQREAIVRFFERARKALPSLDSNAIQLKSQLLRMNPSLNSNPKRTQPTRFPYPRGRR